MADSRNSPQNDPPQQEDITAPAAQAQSIAAASANEPMLEPHRAMTPRIVHSAELDGPLSDERASTGGTFSNPQADAMSSISELDAGEVPPPAYSERHNQITLSQGGLKTTAHLQDDGRIDIDIKEDSQFVSNLLMPALRRSLLYEEKHAIGDLPPGYIPPSLGGHSDIPPPPPMNVVIHVVGSRGDVQPFIALGKVLKETYSHRVRLATHPVFKDFVTENGLEFFSIGGDPAELMAFMVKNPGLMPGTDALKNGDVRKRRKGMYEIVQRCWRSCYEAGDGMDIPSTDSNASENFEGSHKPFVADAIIANPPSFAHIHCAEKLGIPLHLMFTMPWSPTQAFPHPLANIQRSTADVSMTNFLSYVLVELMTWQGLGDVINRFREKYLGLEPLSTMWAPALASRLRIPFTYCWSPALISKPKDWGPHITVSGFYFLSLASNYQPAADLQRFLDAGPPPVYIGFGSIVVDDPNAMTRLIFEAVKLSGQRALVSKGWGGFGASELDVPDNIFMLGNVPHDWLFRHVSCVVHHGGAGTTAAGIALGCPTVIVPFFGDQPFWGAMVSRAGAGPDPIPSKQLTAEMLAQGIKEALTESSVQRAKELAASIAHEKGSDLGAKYFHDALDVDNMRCSLAPSRVAVWRIKRTNVRLSALAAAVLGQEGRLNFSDLRLHRPKECEAEETPYEPIGGAASALLGTVGSMMMGLADIPTDIWRAMSKKAVAEELHDDQMTAEHSSGEGSSGDGRPITPTSQSSQTFTTSSTDPTNSGLHPQRSPRRPTSPGRRTPTSSRSGSRTPTGTKSPESPGRSPITMETAMDMTRGIGRFTEAGLKSPMDFTLALAKGFRNAPKLYGDTTIRPATKVTGFQSGLKASAKEFGFGMYDGISGLVTQPMEAVKKEGASGFFKGFAKGIGGITLKPAAAFWAIPGYTFQGIYKEIKKSSGASLQNYIIAARTAQGFEDWGRATPEERRDIVTRWDAMQDEITQQKKQWYSPYMRTLANVKAKQSHSESKKQDPTYAQSQLSPLSPEQRAGAASGGFGGPPSPFRPRPEPASGRSPREDPSHTPSIPRGNRSDYEEAIQRSVQATSRGDAEEDAMVEEAIRQSLADLQNRPRLTEEEEAQARAIRADLHRAQGQPGSSRESLSSDQWQMVESDDEDLRRAIEASQEMTREEKEEELELAQALYESRKAHNKQLKDQADEDAVVEYIKKHTLEESQGQGESQS